MDGSLRSPASLVGVDEHEAARVAAIVDYYTRVGADYGHWSALLHMHFGRWQRSLSPFEREPMLVALAALVHARLGLADDARGTVLDLGCGVGSSARQLAGSHAGVDVLGLTLTPAQVAIGTELTAALGLSERVRVVEADYRAVPCTDASAIGAYAIESACYDPDDGAGLIREAARVLRPGARLVVADAFRRRPLSSGAAWCERNMAAGWALTELNERSRFEAALREHGFELESCEDNTLRVLPSALHVPLAVLGFRLRNGTLDPLRRAHLRACLWSLVCVMLWPRRFGYFVITARRRQGLPGQP